MPGEVLVVGEIADGQISPTTRELLAAGRQVADDAGVQLAVALAGSAPEEAARDAGAAGADKLTPYNTPFWLSIKSTCTSAPSRACAAKWSPVWF